MKLVSRVRQVLQLASGAADTDSAQALIAMQVLSSGMQALCWHTT